MGATVVEAVTSVDVGAIGRLSLVDSPVPDDDPMLVVDVLL